jgi:hypothetical protein
VTTTPVFNGRSFGTNVIEAVLIAISGQNRKLTRDELFRMLNQTGIGPQLQKLN